MTAIALTIAGSDSSGGAGIPEGLDALIAACLEKDRVRRPQTMSAVIDALDRLASRLAWTQDDAAAWWEIHGERNGAGARARVRAGGTA